MTWLKINMDDYDFCMGTDTGEYQVRRKGEQVGLWYLDHRIGWYVDVEDAMFMAWVLELKKGEKTWKKLNIINN